ncbi:DNA ligase 1-like isoform X2 [Scylla paramamosain]|uniref:DNA ligase 1-like isoform X2 n=1 Tax=Scylla paramamosain TaxID=85552 RepID=UPI003082C20B
MDDLVVEKLGKAVNGGENGTSGAPSQTDLLKLLAGGSAGGLGGCHGGLGGLGSLAAAAQARQNGSLMRPYEALLQGPSAAGRMGPQAVAMPGPTRRRKKKRRRQPDMPKKACTPFMHFCAYFKRKLMEEGKEFPQFADFGKRAGELWRNMGDTEKQKFVELSEQDRQRYIKDMKEYEERKLAEKERERELQQQREKELQVLREKELEKLQKQQREQMEQQQKQMEQHHKHQQSTGMLNLLNPLNPLNPLMIAAMNQSIMQTMLTNPDLMKTVYSEAARNYYVETMKNLYQSASSQANGNASAASAGVHVSTSGAHGGLGEHHGITTSPLSTLGMNLNLLSLLNSGQLSAVPSSTPTSTTTTTSASSPLANKAPSALKAPPTSLLSTTNSLSAAALDLSAARPGEGKAACNSDEENF